MPEIELPNVEELEEIKGKKFTKRVALTTAIFAVILAITSLGGNNAMKEMLLAQQQASDQWSFYQAKVVREHLYRIQKLRLKVDLLERGRSMKPEAREKLESMLKNMAEEETKYGTEKKEIEKEAKKLEHERDVNRSKRPVLRLWGGAVSDRHCDGLHLHHFWFLSDLLFCFGKCNIGNPFFNQWLPVDLPNCFLPLRGRGRSDWVVFDGICIRNILIKLMEKPFSFHTFLLVAV